ncbi:uncharacterized protein LOC142324946 isoform X3 [Lycorma delicatula]|uniref:uncharacterized protein LOC142324946 isoform X3 n=1 Tax=Lycorma delicatula TaxID=130591 RepID=UPI003F512C14
MVLQGSVLQAIQDIPGDTKAKKLKYICEKGNEIADKGTGWESVPESVHYLVNVEVSKRLKESEHIIKLLNCEDAYLVKRVLYIDNLFSDKCNLLRSFDYFYQEILSNVSVETRNRVIKKVADDLMGRDPKLAEEFFIGMTRTYGVKSALKILLSCSEDFIYDQIMKYKIILYVDLVKELYIKHPSIAIKYLKLSIYNENNVRRKLHDVRIENYVNFLPYLIKDHFEEFFELYNSSNSCKSIRLSKKKTKFFLKKGLALLKEEPNNYLQILNLELVTKRLRAEDFHVVIAGMFPDEIKDYKVDDIFNLLRYYSSSKKVPLIRSIFNEIYGDDLYNFPEKVSADMLLVLPTDDRIRLARLKLEQDPEPPADFKTSWRCYLSAEEAIPLLRKEISESSSDEDRLKLLKEMIYVCKVNDNKAALLKVLNYFVQRHKNEAEPILSSILRNLHSEYELYKLDKEHWKVLDDFVKRLHVKNYFSCINCILEDGFYYKLQHELPIDEYITLCLQMNLKSNCWRNWNYLESYPNYEKLCLEKFLNMIGVIYPDHDDIWKKQSKVYILDSLISSIGYFNTRNKHNENISSIDIKEHPWIMKNIECLLKDENSDVSYLKLTLKSVDIELYNTWFKDDNCEPEYLDIRSIKIINILKTDYIKILRDWEHYLSASLNFIWSKQAQNFVRSIRWYKDIPINFAERLLKILDETKTSKASTMLGFLLDGPLFEKIIDPLIPFEPSIDTEKDDMKNEYEIVCNCLQGILKCSPPVSFNILKRLCTSDYLLQLIKVLYAVAQKTSVREVIRFVEYLVNQCVSVKKHGIYLMCLTVSLEQKCNFLFNAWKSESHKSISNILLLKIRHSFIDTPNDQTWNIIQVCFQDQMVVEEKVLRRLAILDGIPDEYVVPYIKAAITSFEQLKIEKKQSLPKHLIMCIFNRLKEPFKEILPVDFQQELIKRYFFNARLDSDIARINSEFIFKVYLTDSSEGSRLSFFSQYLINFIKASCNESDSKKLIFSPARELISELIKLYLREIGSGYRYPQLTKVFKEALGQILLPHECSDDFLRLTWTEIFEDTEVIKDFTLMVAERLDFLISLFGKEFTLIIALSLNEFLHLCYTKDNLFDFIDGITEIKAVSTFTVATVLFLKNSSCFSSSTEYLIVKKLGQLCIPTVQAVINSEIYIKKLS